MFCCKRDTIIEVNYSKAISKLWSLNLDVLITPSWKCVFWGDLVSHNDFHGGPSLSNLYDGARDGHNLHFDVHVWMHIKCMGFTTKNFWFVHMTQLCCPGVVINLWEVGRPGEQLYITTKCWASRDLGMNILASGYGGIPNYFTSQIKLMKSWCGWGMSNGIEPRLPNVYRIVCVSWTLPAQCHLKT
jgi:hypothetical protein